MKVMIVEIPSFEDVLDAIEGAVGNVKKKSADVFKNLHHRFDFEEDEDDDDDEWCLDTEDGWDIGGEPADENLRFGYGLEVDEPRRSDYSSRREFERDHELFDDFVTAGERCVERGLDKRNNAQIHKCNAIRRPVNCPPPMGIDLIGETDWWDEDFEW